MCVCVNLALIRWPWSKTSSLNRKAGSGLKTGSLILNSGMLDWRVNCPITLSVLVTRPTAILPYANDYFSLAERGDRDEKCFLINHTSCVCCANTGNVVFSHARRGFSPVVCRQLSLPPALSSLLLGCVFLFLLSVGGRIVF